MKVFYNHQFRGHYPVGTSAVVVAYDAYDAADRLEAELRNAGLPQTIPTNDMIEIELAPQVIILQDGNY